MKNVYTRTISRYMADKGFTLKSSPDDIGVAGAYYDFYDKDGVQAKINAFQFDNIYGGNLQHLRDVPVKEGKRRVAFLVDNFFIGNSSGIFIFIKHFAQMCREHDMLLDLIVDQDDLIEIPKGFDTDVISYFWAPGLSELGETAHAAFSREYEGEVRPKLFELNLKEYLKEFNPGAIVAHSYSTTRTLNMMPELGNRRLAYTHIGDIMDPNNLDMLDFGSELTRDYIEVLGDINFPIGTQTIASQNAIQALLPKAKVKLLPEPFYEPKIVYQTPDGTKGVLIVSSNYERKRFDKMFEVLAITGLPVTVCTGLDRRGYDGKTLKEMATEAGIQGYRQLDNVPNDYLLGIIKQHRVLLHLSDIEVMPYALLESSPHIPCIVNGNAPYAQDLPCPVTKVDPDDIFECVSTIMDCYGDTFEYRGFDVRDYADKSEKAWKELTNEHC